MTSPSRGGAGAGPPEPPPVQAQAIPLVLEGRDLLAAAQTGTGKTAAFALPILQRLKPQANSSFSPARPPARALAVRVEEATRTYARHLPLLRLTTVYGGVPIDPQTAALRGGVEILVATPGRLLDHVGQRNVALGQVEGLVLL